MTFNGAEHPLRGDWLQQAELIVDRMPVESLTTSRPFGYSIAIVENSYSVGGFDIEVIATKINIGIKDNTAWDGFILGSDELDEFLTILNYHHQKAKGML